MYRGTTPTITINCDIDVSEFVTMWVTFRTQQLATYAPPKQVEVTKHLGDEGVDSAGTVVIGEVDYLDDNTVRLTFCAAFSGTAYFN